MCSSQFVSHNEIRTLFTQALSGMYQLEVPLYTKLLSLVDKVNQQTVNNNNSPSLTENENSLLGLEHHGAIRVGTAEELSMVRRLFAVMGMRPVDYYDLSVAGIPVHSTAFRALDKNDLNESPFRVFCSLLRLDLIDDEDLAQQSTKLLDNRQIFPDELLKLIELLEKQGGAHLKQLNTFINNALEVFRWHQNATVNKATYDALKSSHGLIADVVSFKGPHINHLTPKVLDIDLCQKQFSENGIKAKAVVEGPPERKCPILLRQTSFLAIAEEVIFTNGETGLHSARFGEVEQRGIALTPKGRDLYDKLLSKAKSGDTEIEYTIHLNNAFKNFPDDYDQMRQQELAYFYYSAVKFDEHLISNSNDIELLIEQGLLKASPIIYEDFLPVSAAGIFTSNLSLEPTPQAEMTNDSIEIKNSNKAGFEDALGVKIENGFSLYEKTQQQSLIKALGELGLDA